MSVPLDEELLSWLCGQAPVGTSEVLLLQHTGRNHWKALSALLVFSYQNQDRTKHFHRNRDSHPSLVCCQRLTFLYFVVLSIVTDCGWRSLQVIQRAVAIQRNIVTIDAGLNERFFDPLIFDPVCGHTICPHSLALHLSWVVHEYCTNHRIYFFLKQKRIYYCRTILSVIQI